MVSIICGSAPKNLYAGTHRTILPEATLTTIKPYIRQMGITRVANVTGLDRIGIPVAIAVRPNSRSVSIAQGKGQSEQLARASAVMEAAETWHAEQLGDRVRYATLREAKTDCSVADLAALPRTNRTLADDEPIGWVEAIDLYLQTRYWVPAELVHTDYTIPSARGSGYFLASTNGLASGNHMLEAMSAAICELVERDAVALWHARPPQLRAASHLKSASITDAACEALLGRYATAGMQVRMWDVTSDIGIPAFLCWIREADGTSGSPGNTFAGAGCHPDPAVALSRALTEAAQTRLNVIVGARDDLPTDYQVRAAAAVGPVLLDAFAASLPAVDFDAIAGFRSDDLADDVRWELSCLRRAGLSQVIVVDLTNTEIGIPVIRAVIPGLEGNCHHPSYVPGARARAIGVMR